MKINLFFTSGFFNTLNMASVIEQYNLHNENNYLFLLVGDQSFEENKKMAEALYDFKGIGRVGEMLDPKWKEYEISKIFIPHETSFEQGLNQYEILNFNQENTFIVEEGWEVYRKSQFRKYILFPELNKETGFKIDKKVFLKNLSKLESIWDIPLLKKNSVIFIMPHLHYINKENFYKEVLNPLYNRLIKKYNVYIKAHPRDEILPTDLPSESILPDSPPLIDLYFLKNKSRVKALIGLQSTSLLYMNKLFNIPSYYIPQFDVQGQSTYLNYDYITKNILHKVAKNIDRLGFKFIFWQQPIYKNLQSKRIQSKRIMIFLYAFLSLFSTGPLKRKYYDSIKKILT